MKSPWKRMAPLEEGGTYVVLASSIPPRSRRSTAKLFRGAQAVKRQLRQAEGLMGFSMLARPMRKQYGTLSIWRDEAALGAFASSGPHGELMSELAPLMDEPVFVRWTISGDDRRPTWKEAARRLRQASAAGSAQDDSDGSQSRSERARS